jgi:MYND finger
LLKYLSHSHSEGLSSHVMDIYNGEENEDPFNNYPNQGPSAAQHYRDLLELVDQQTANTWLEYFVQNPPWKQEAFLFSEKDNQRLIEMIETFDKQKNNVLLGVWECLSYSYQNPCIFVIPQLLTMMVPLIINANRINQLLVTNNITSTLTEYNPFFKMAVNGMFIKEHQKYHEFIKQYSYYPRSSLKNNRIIYIQSPCISCGLIPKTPQKCGGSCKDESIIYCNTECQKKHWKEKHSKECGTK